MWHINNGYFMVIAFPAAPIDDFKEGLKFDTKHHILSL